MRRNLIRDVLGSVRGLMLLVVGLAVIPLFGLQLYTAVRQREHELTEARERAAHVGRMVAEEHEHLAVAARQLVIAIAELPSVRRRDSSACTALLRRIVSEKNHYTIVSVASPTGEIFCSSHPLRGTVSVADGPVFKKAMETRSLTIGDYQTGRITGRRGYLVAQPALARDGGVEAVVFAAFDTAWIDDLFHHTGVPAGTVVGVVNAEGEVLVRYPDPKGWTGSTSRLVPVAVLRERPGGDVFGARDHDGVPHLVALVPLATPPTGRRLWVFTATPTAAIFAAADRVLRVDILGGIVITMLAIAAAWCVGEVAIVRRLRTVGHAANRLGAGDLAARSGLPHDRGLFGELARSFDDMAVSIEKLTRTNALILDSAAEGIWGMDASGAVVFVNAATCRMLGFEPRELLGTGVHDLVHHTHADGRPYPVSECRVHRAWRDGRTEHVADEVFWRKDGTSFPVEYTVTPMRDGDAIVGGVLTFSDISERRRAETVLRESRARLQHVLSQTPAIIYSRGAGGDFPLTWISDNVQAVLGYESARFVDEDGFFAERVHPADAPGLAQRLRRALDGGDHVHEYRVRHADGRHRWVRDEMRLVPGAPGHAAEIIGSLVDITDRREAEEQARIHAAALAAAANGVVITDREGRIEWVNAAFSEMTGFSAAEAVGRTPRILRSEAQEPEFYASMWRTIREGGVWRGELTNRRRDGSLYREEMSITPVRSGPDGITHFVAIKQDVSERERVAERLRRQEEYFRALIRHALDVIAVVDENGVFTFVSPSVESVLEYAPEALIGTNVFSLLHPDDMAPAREVFRLLRGGPGRTASLECRVRHRDGSWLVLETVGRNLPDHPEVRGVILNSRDVTERRRTEEERQRLRAQLSQSEKLAVLGELLAGVAHELNNPLTVVIGQAAMLERDDGEPRARRRAASITAAAQRCARIVRNFLALSRQYPPERAWVDLNQVVREAVELLAYGLRVDGVTVALELTEGIPDLWIDRHEMHQVLVNLVTNAHHAMRESAGPRVLTIASRPRPAGDRVELEVTDSGPGIPPAVEARLFEPFFTTKPVGQGTGLGLSICKALVEAHGGTIDVEGRPGLGARFRVTIPVGKPSAPDADRAQAETAPAPATVLVVDDEAEITTVVADILAVDDHDVDTAENGVAALRRLEQRRYDVILTDVRMPELDGIGFYQEVCRRDPELGRRLGFITGDVVDVETTRYIEQTGRPCVTKPFGAADVRAVVRKILMELGASNAPRPPLAPSAPGDPGHSSSARPDSLPGSS